MFYYEKPPLVFVHGLAEDHSIFNRQVAFLKEKGFVTYASDLAGHGNTPLPSGKLTIARHASDLERILDTEGIEIANLIGFSLGGTISLEFAYKKPHRVGKMCLINPGLCIDKFMTWKIKLLAPFLKVLEYASKLDKKQRLNEIDLSKSPFSTVYYSFPYGLKKINLHSLDLNLHALLDYGVPEYLNEIKTETLILRGKNDELLKRESVLHLQEQLANSDLIEIPGNHVVMLSNTAEVNKVLWEYFSC